MSAHGVRLAMVGAAAFLVAACGAPEDGPPLDIAFTGEVTEVGWVEERGIVRCAFTLRLEAEGEGQARLVSGSIVRREGSRQPEASTLGRFQIDEWWGGPAVRGGDDRAADEVWEGDAPFQARVTFRYESADSVLERGFDVDCRP